MKTMAIWFCALLLAGLVGGCASPSSDASANSSSVKMSGYVDTSIQRRF
ncbi:MAG: hypothetical protein JWR26_358 [Pedosphaera sp.]|nr:hypothetical protein [Pedosphaera sp.]